MKTIRTRKKISSSTIRRLSKYYRTLQRQMDKNYQTISSAEIAHINNITAAQVRKDLSYFGSFGKRGTGYNISELQSTIADILGLKKQWNVALVGFGNIGRALLHYDEFKKQGFKIKAIFDQDDSKIGHIADMVQVYDISDACEIIKEQQIEIMIVAVPAPVAQKIIDIFVECGIKAFLNFAPIPIKVPENVLVKHENMAIELESLSYFITNKKKGA